MSYIGESKELIPAIKHSIGTGLSTIDGVITDLLIVNSDTSSSLDVLGGTGQIIRNPSLGVNTHRFIIWDAITIPSGQTAGNFVVAIEDSGSGNGTVENPAIGTIIIIDNNNASDLTPKQAVESIQLGNFSMVNGVITQTFITPALSAGLVSSKYTSDFGLGPYNFPGQLGFFVNPIVAALQMGISAGSVYSQGAGAIDDIEISDEIIRPVRSPTPLIGLGDPVTGAFAFSATAEVDPLRVSKQGVITAFAANGGNTQVTSNGHGIVINDIVTITNTTNYNSTFNVIANTGNTYNIDTAFVANDATGNWSALTATANSRFTGQRIFLFPQSGIVAPLYGMAEYITIDDYDAANGEDSEGFVAPPIVEKATRTNTLIIEQGITNFGQTNLFQIRKAASRLKA